MRRLDEAAATAEAVSCAREAAASGRRALLGLTGPPGAGKSSTAAALVAAVDRDAGPGTAVVVGMDGFHLAQAELVRVGRADRKGAPDTFDAAGFVALLRRLVAREPLVYAPVFDRRLEEPIAGVLAVPDDVVLVVIEGNYLLSDGAWEPVRELLDVVWFLEPDPSHRVEALIARHVAHGRTPAAAREWVLRSDEANARVVAASRERADAVCSWW